MLACSYWSDTLDPKKFKNEIKIAANCEYWCLFHLSITTAIIFNEFYIIFVIFIKTLRCDEIALGDEKHENQSLKTWTTKKIHKFTHFAILPFFNKPFNNKTFQFAIFQMLDFALQNYLQFEDVSLILVHKFNVFEILKGKSA